MGQRSVYNSEDFQYRVDFAANVISRMGRVTRHFDTCFEMYDGHAVAAALMRRARANSAAPLAKNLPRYICEKLALENHETTKHLTRSGLAEYAAELRAEGQRKADEVLAQLRESQELVAGE
jgi:hypothetical protein